MAEKLAGVEHVQRIELPEHPGIYLFEVQRREREPLFVIWERRDTFSGEDEPLTPVRWQWSSPQALATDVFGKGIPAQVSDGQVHLLVSLTPVFLES